MQKLHGLQQYIFDTCSGNSTNAIYLVECINSKRQYVGSDTSFKQHFRIHKSDVETK